MNLGIVAILWFGGFRVDSGRLTQGEIIAFVNYMTQILQALIVVANLVVIFTKASASASRINEVLETEPSVSDAVSGEVAPLADEAALEFDRVAFAYAGAEEPSLSGITVKLRPGETLGVIGGTGSGKSTFVSLIPRFYDATSGEVKVFGRDVKEYPLAELRRLVGTVPQKAAVVSGTIRENLRWAKPDATTRSCGRR